MKQPLLSPYTRSVREDTGRFGNPRCRFTVLYAFLVVLFATLPLWLSAVVPDDIAWINALILCFFTLCWLAIAVCALRNFSRLGLLPLPGLRGLSAARRRIFRHIVIVPCYLDPLNVLMECLYSLATQTHPDRLVVVVTFEAKTPELESKIAAVRQLEKNNVFGALLIVVHQLRPGVEIAGGCSNKNFALNQAYNYLIRTAAEPVAPSTMCYTITTCDTDSLFHPQYFSVLETMYNYENPRLDAPPANVVWQAPLFYNWNLSARPFFTRVTAVMRSMMMLGGLVSFNLNPMSIFSYPLELGLQSSFINPRYGVDDIIAKVRWMCDTNEQVPVRLLPVPVISGPTIGTTFWEDVMEWARQIRRWAVGSSESFHYFVIHWRGKPFFSALWWLFCFTVYYAVLLCSAGVFSVLSGIPLPWTSQKYASVTLGSWDLRFSAQAVGVAALLLQYLVFFAAFVIDHLAVRMLTVDDHVHPLRTLLHWISAPFVLFVYSVISFYSIVKFVFVGKGMARHDMAAKEGLISVTDKDAVASDQRLDRHRRSVERDAVHTRESEVAASMHTAANVADVAVEIGADSERKEDLQTRIRKHSEVHVDMDLPPTINFGAYSETFAAQSVRQVRLHSVNRFAHLDVDAHVEMDAQSINP